MADAERKQSEVQYPGEPKACCDAKKNRQLFYCTQRLTGRPKPPVRVLPVYSDRMTARSDGIASLLKGAGCGILFYVGMPSSMLVLFLREGR